MVKVDWRTHVTVNEDAQIVIEVKIVGIDLLMEWENTVTLSRKDSLTVAQVVTAKREIE